MEISAEFATTCFREPKRMILNEVNLEDWFKSPGYFEIKSFISHINSKTTGLEKSVAFSTEFSECIKGLDFVLSALEKMLLETPPQKETSRYGNPAFREWHEKLNKEGTELIGKILPKRVQSAKTELAVYFMAAFGNPTRIDYGSGHELNFVIFIYCLFSLEVLIEKDIIPAILVIFERYMLFVRKLQTVYSLEPAGSHGVWGLDDFQFLPYVWGSSQLIENVEIQPVSILDSSLSESLASEYMFFGAINFIYKTKKGPFHEHSSLLHSISSVPLWSKVNKGLLRMFDEEVLKKFPVVQHLLFGSIFKFSN